MIRERRLGNIAYPGPGQQSSYDLPKDCVYHQLQIAMSGSITAAYPSGTAVSSTQFAPGFPFNLIQKISLIRNGSDVVFSGSGRQLSKESAILNGVLPFARLWVDTASGTGTAGAL